jgi:ABC-type polysaccharide/polyol phosphate export permease
MAPVIDGYRKSILEGVSPDILGVGLAFLVSLFSLLLAYRTFKTLERVFADII